MARVGPFPAFVAIGATVFAALRLWRGGRLRGAEQTLARGEPRRSRAMARLLARSLMPPARDRLHMHEAAALFWEGEFERAAARADSVIAEGRDTRRRASAIALQVLAAVLGGRVEQARRTFDGHRDEIAATRARPVWGIGA